MSFTKEVKTANGNTKTVVAGTQEELDEAVEAAENEPKVVAPNIDDPSHGNYTTAEFADFQTKGEAGHNDEAVPSADRPKEVAREASVEAGLVDGDSKEEVKDDKKKSSR